MRRRQRAAVTLSNCELTVLLQRTQRAQREQPPDPNSFATFAGFAVNCHGKTYSLGCVVSTCLAMASAKPSMVYSSASILVLKPACRSVSLVTGPMEASH